MLVAVAAMGFTACQTDVEIDQPSVDAVKGTTITVLAGFNEDTRATLVDGEGEFLVNWEESDSVIFKATATDGTFTYATSEQTTLKNEGAAAEFTATFSKEVAAGSTIEAYIYGYYYTSWEGYYDYNWNWISEQTLGNNSLYYQYPKQDAPGYIVASASFEYNGEELISEPVNFTHEYGYGKVTLPEGTDVYNIVLEFNDNYTYRLQDCYNIEGNTYWFVADPMEVSVMDVTVNTNDGVTLVKSVDMTAVEKPLFFKAGKVSTFSLGNFITKLEQTWGSAVADVNSIKFTWEPVENATSYDIVLYKGYETVESKNVTVCEYTATGLDANTKYSLSIVAKAEGYADSDKATIDTTTLVSRESLEAWVNHPVVFTHMRKLTPETDSFYSNGYLFSTREITGKPTQDDTFMYLAFNDSSVDFTKEGSYDIDDLAYSWCYIWSPDITVPYWSGWSDNYNLGWNPYHFYPNEGDTYQVYVEVVDGKPSVTVYASCSWWSDIHFKGTWTEGAAAEGGDEPETPGEGGGDEPETPETPETPEPGVADGKTYDTAYTFTDCTLTRDSMGYPCLTFSGSENEAELYLSGNYQTYFKTGLYAIDNPSEPAWYTKDCWYKVAGESKPMNAGNSYTYFDKNASGYIVDYIYIKTTDGTELYYKYKGTIVL